MIGRNDLVKIQLIITKNLFKKKKTECNMRTMTNQINLQKNMVT